METRKLYYEDSHLFAFTAIVTACETVKNGYEIVLDATAFYPEGGGQAADTGLLGGVRVLDTKERGETVVHICEGPLEVGAVVEGTIDYEARFLRMQQHSGEHIVSGIIHRRYGYHNVGFHMGSELITIDFDGVIPAEDLPEIEGEANRAVWANLPVKCWYPSEEELPQVFYRTKRALPWPVRIVEVPGFDSCACCGTHVQATGEIGLIKLFSAVGLRGGTRMEMACGRAALQILNRAYEQNRQVSQAFSAQITETGAAAKRMNEALAEQKYRIVGLEKRIFAGIARSYAGMGQVIHFEENLENTAVRELADAIAEHCGGTAAVFSGSDEAGYAFCLVTRNGDLRQLGKDMTKALNGRGGGKPNFQQGRVQAARADIEAFFAQR
ncbi:MAG: alanyl-tRNA editing protein [Oscillospiraceae bacterium]|nr:alanyl-tRNA editing protein [Oscillospiraceae bacterium]